MASFTKLEGMICLVTGATRGIGKGIALQLGQAGATVYITGRTLKSKGTGGSLEETAAEIEARGGRCVPVCCDHSKDEEVERLFEKIQTDENGRLDVLVNNAYAGVQAIIDGTEKKQKFYEMHYNVWDSINNVGLRNHYVCTVLGSRMMLERGKGLIINISSWGGLRYLFNVPYGIGKQALDRMAADCAIQLRKKNVTCISLWPGPVMTETISTNMNQSDNKDKKALFSEAESPEFAGKAIVNLAADSNVHKKTGRILLTAELGEEYGFVDIDGTRVRSLRCVNRLLQQVGVPVLPSILPNWIRTPYWMLTLSGSKF